MRNEADLRVQYYERDARESRARFMGTLAELRHRAHPRVIAAETVDALVNRAVGRINDTATTIRKRPGVTLGSLAGLGIGVGLQIWLARRKVRTDAT